MRMNDMKITHLQFTMYTRQHLVSQGTERFVRTGQEVTIRMQLSIRMRALRKHNPRNSLMADCASPILFPIARWYRVVATFQFVRPKA